MPEHFHILIDRHGNQVDDVWDADVAFCACSLGGQCPVAPLIHLPIESELVLP